MSGLEIPPHSRRLSGLAVTFLSLLAVGSFVSGLNHQLITGHDRAAFPPPPAEQAAAPALQAPPAPTLQLANARPARHAAKDPVAVDAAAPADSPAPADAAKAEAPPAVDAAATAPDPVGPAAVPNI